MQSKHPNLDWLVGDGTLDVMIHGTPWDPPEEVQENVRQYVNEVTRILKPEGRWLYITFRQPHFVKPHLVREGIWDLAVHHLQDGPGTFDYFAYIMTKYDARNGRTTEVKGKDFTASV